MCSKTCWTSNLFCIICLLVELTGGQSPISPYNFGGGGAEQIHPIQSFGRPPYFQQPSYGVGIPYGGGIGGGGYSHSQFINPITSRQMQQEMLFQQQQRIRNAAVGYRGGFSGFSAPSFAPIRPQPIFGQMPYAGRPYGSPIDPRPDIPTEIVVGRQAPLAARERAATLPAFGALLTGGGAPLAPPPAPSDDALQSMASGAAEQRISPTVDSQLPAFLQGAPVEAIEAFKRIIRQPNLKYEEQVKRIEAMVNQQLDPEHQALYRNFMRENDEREERHRERIHKLVGEMSAKAQEQFAKISAILRGPGTPDSERWDRVLNVYARMDPRLRDEFESRFKDFGALASGEQ